MSDSLWGRLAPGERWGELLSNVQTLQVRKFDVLGTVLYPVAIMGVIIAGFAVTGGMKMDMQMDLGL